MALSTEIVGANLDVGGNVKTALALAPEYMGGVRLSLGNQSFLVGALAGANSERCDVNMDAPVVVEPGTYCHIILRVPYGTATASELFRGCVGFNAYWE